MSRKIIFSFIMIFAGATAWAQSGDLIWGAINGLSTLTKPAGGAKVDLSRRISGHCSVTTTPSSNSLCQQLQVKLIDQNQKIIQTTWTDASGFFEFFDVPRGEYSINPGFSNFKIENNGSIKPGGKVSLLITE